MTPNEYKENYGKIFYIPCSTPSDKRPPDPTFKDRISAPSRDPYALLKLIEKKPEMFLCASKSIMTDDFIIKAIETNRSVFLLLPKDGQACQKFIDAYANSIDLSYCRPTTTIDPRLFFSIQNYANNYEKMLLCGSYRIAGMAGDRWAEKNKHSMFVFYAHRANPEMIKQYNETAHDIILKHKNEVCRKVCLGYDVDYLKMGGENLAPYWMDEVRRHCPEIMPTIIQYRHDYCEEIKQIIKSTKPIRYGKDTNFVQWLRDDIAAHPEEYPKELVKEASICYDMEIVNAHTKEVADVKVMDKVDEIIEYIDAHRDEVSQAIEDGRLSFQNIVDIIGQKYDMSFVGLNEQLLEQNETDQINIEDTTGGLDEPTVPEI